jgi:HSP20 family protein
MFGLTRWSPVDDVFNFQREVDRLFNQFWSDLPSRSSSGASSSLQVNATDEGWRIQVPMPGVDPKHVNLEVAGNTLTVRAEEPGNEGQRNNARYEHTITLPQFLDIDKLKATSQHGMLCLTLPLKESVKPRRIQIEAQSEEQRQLTAAR